MAREACNYIINKGTDKEQKFGSQKDFLTYLSGEEGKPLMKLLGINDEPNKTQEVNDAVQNSTTPKFYGLKKWYDNKYKDDPDMTSNGAKPSQNLPDDPELFMKDAKNNASLRALPIYKDIQQFLKEQGGQNAVQKQESDEGVLRHEGVSRESELPGVGKENEELQEPSQESQTPETGQVKEETTGGNNSPKVVRSSAPEKIPFEDEEENKGSSDKGVPDLDAVYKSHLPTFISDLKGGISTKDAIERLVKSIDKETDGMWSRPTVFDRLNKGLNAMGRGIPEQELHDLVWQEQQNPTDATEPPDPDDTPAEAAARIADMIQNAKKIERATRPNFFIRTKNNIYNGFIGRLYRSANAVAGEKGRATALIYNQVRGVLNGELLNHSKEIRALRNIIDRLPTKQKFQYMLEVTGRKPISDYSPFIQGTNKMTFEDGAKYLQGALDDAGHFLEMIKPEDWKYLEEYFPGLWENDELAKNTFDNLVKKNKKVSIQGGTFFLEHKVIRSIEQGFKLGLKLKTDNVSNLVDMYLHGVAKMEMGYNLLNRLLDAGLVKPSYAGAKNLLDPRFNPNSSDAIIPADYVPADYSLFRSFAHKFDLTDENGNVVKKGNFYIAPESKVLLDAIYGKSMIANIAHTLRLFGNLGNALNFAQLGISAFHAMTTSTAYINTQMGLAWQNLLSGEGREAAHHLFNTVTAPYKMFSFIPEIRHLKEYANNDHFTIRKTSEEGNPDEYSLEFRRGVQQTPIFSKQYETYYQARLAYEDVKRIGAVLDNEDNHFKKGYFEAGNFGDPLLNMIMDAGGKIEQDPIYTIHTQDIIRHSLNRIKNEKLPWFDGLGDPSKAGQYGKIAINSVFGAMGATTNFIMRHYVPLLKIHAFNDIAQSELRLLNDSYTKQLSKLQGNVARYSDGKHPDEYSNAKSKLDDFNKLSFNDRRLRSLQDSWDRVDNRFGQVVYDKWFMNRMLKQGAFLTFRAFGWTFGNIKELGGSVNVAKNVRRMKEGRGITPETGYMLGIITSTVVSSGLFNYLKYGRDGVSHWRDFIGFRTGKKNRDGTDQYVFPTAVVREMYQYGRDVPTTTLKEGVLSGGGQFIKDFSNEMTNKITPSYSFIKELASNKDYFGNSIINHTDWFSDDERKNFFTRLGDSKEGDVFKYAIQNFTPIAFRDQTGQDKSMLTKDYWLDQIQGTNLLQKVGILKAPLDFDRETYQNMIMDYFYKNNGAQTSIKSENQYILQGNIEKAIANVNVGDKDANEVAINAMIQHGQETGLLTDKQDYDYFKRDNESYFPNKFANLQVPQMLHILGSGLVDKNDYNALLSGYNYDYHFNAKTVILDWYKQKENQDMVAGSSQYKRAMDIVNNTDANLFQNEEVRSRGRHSTNRSKQRGRK